MTSILFWRFDAGRIPARHGAHFSCVRVLGFRILEFRISGDFKMLRSRANAVVRGCGGPQEHFLLASGAKSCHNWSTSAQEKPSNPSID
jgi:hypothetical protein